jgi:branched-chain amino acid transport system substrate-binding protein
VARHDVAPTGAPFKVFFINEQGASATASDPEDTSAAEAAVSYINKNLGGIKGRPVQITTCATLGTSESMISCARQPGRARQQALVRAWVGFRG